MSYLSSLSYSMRCFSTPGTTACPTSARTYNVARTGESHGDYHGNVDGLPGLPHDNDAFLQLAHDGAHALSVRHLIRSLQMSWHAAKSGSCTAYPYTNNVSFQTTWTYSPDETAACSDFSTTATNCSIARSGVERLPTLYLPPTCERPSAENDMY